MSNDSEMQLLINEVNEIDEVNLAKLLISLKEVEE